VPKDVISEPSQNPDEPSTAKLSSCRGNKSLASRAFPKDDMKRTKRLSIEYRHREVTITVEGSTLHVQNREPVTDDVPATCPTCGSPWMAIVVSGVEEGSLGVDRIVSMLQQAGLHMRVSSSGQLRICQRSFEELKEKL